MDNESDDLFKNINDPYWSKPLFDIYRKLIFLIGNYNGNTIHGIKFRNITKQHDDIRQLVTWNFIDPVHEQPRYKYETDISVTDWNISYKITNQARRFVKLEFNNVSDLRKGILILLRADFMPEIKKGISLFSVRMINFYQLVILLNQSESKILQTLRDLETLNYVELKLIFDSENKIYSGLTEISITENGLLFMDNKKNISMKYITIIDSTVGVLAIESTLTNIDVNIGKAKQQGYEDFANSLTDFTEQIIKQQINERDKKEIVEQIESISEEAIKEGNDRKPRIVKGAIAMIGNIASTSKNLIAIWNSFETIVKSFFDV